MDIIEAKNEIARLKEENDMLHRLLEVSKPVMEFGYTNWRGEHSVRRVFFYKIQFGSTEWHPKPGYLLEGKDAAKGEVRLFAIADIDGMKKAKPEPKEELKPDV